MAPAAALEKKLPSLTGILVQAQLLFRSSPPADAGMGERADFLCNQSHRTEFHRATMPNSASAKKALRQSQARRLRNRSQRSALRTVLKNCRAAAASGDAEAAQAAFRLAVKKLDQAAAKNLIHKNTAARTKSRLSKLLKQSATA